ncbi:MAG TPA: hypothetical protein VIM77_01000, partial [Mucilaginibacter sp.]
DYTYTFKTDTNINGDKIINVIKAKPGEDEDYYCTYRFNRYKQFIEVTGVETVGLQKTRYTGKYIYYPSGTLFASILYEDKKMKLMYKYFYHK